MILMIAVYGNRLYKVELATMALHKLYELNNEQPGNGRVWEIAENNQEFIIGRGELCNIPVPDNFSTVSRKHATLWVKKGVCYLLDTSTYGTWINNRRLNKGQAESLKNGDHISLSRDYDLEYQLEEADTTEESTITTRQPRALTEICIYQKAIEQVFNACRNAQNVLLLSMPRMGKTNLLNALQRQAIKDHYLRQDASEYLLVYCDMQPLIDQNKSEVSAGVTMQAFFTLLADYLISHLQGTVTDEGVLNRLLAFRERIRNQQDYLLVSDFQQLLEHIQRATKLSKIILLLDHFDEVCRQIDMTRLIRLKQQLDQLQLSFVVAMRRPITAIVPGSAPHINFETSTVRVVLHPLDIEAGFYWTGQLDFINDVNLKNPVAMGLYRWANSHPELIERAIAILRQMRSNGQSIITPNLGLSAELLNQLNRADFVRATCTAIWEGLSLEERTTLKRWYKGFSLTEDDYKIVQDLLERDLLIKDIPDQPGHHFTLFSEPFKYFVSHILGVKEELMTLSDQQQATPAEPRRYFSPDQLPDFIKPAISADQEQELKAATTDLNDDWIKVVPEDFQIIINHKVLSVGDKVGDKGAVTHREFEVLVLLYNNRTRIISDNRVGEEMFKLDNGIFDGANLHRSISRLNEKLSTFSGLEYKFIQRVRGTGYRLHKAK